MRGFTIGVVVAGVLLAASAVRAQCPSGQLFTHHDGSFENGYSWVWESPGAPYGCFAEGYDLGAGTLDCAAYWITNGAGSWGGCNWDLYVWEGGVTRAPGAVTAFFPGVIFHHTPTWPNSAENDYEIDVHVQREFAVGFYDTGNYDSYVYITADCDGLGGHAWTCVPPGHEFPPGWKDATSVFGTTRSLGIGVYFTPDPTPARASTWGSVKALFR